MLLTHIEAEMVAAACVRQGGQIGIPVEFLRLHGELGARSWLDAHLRACGVPTPGSRAPTRRERTVLFLDDLGQVVHGTLLESFVDEQDQDGTGLVTYRIVEHERGSIIAGQIWESPYACREAELGAAP